MTRTKEKKESIICFEQQQEFSQELILLENGQVKPAAGLGCEMADPPKDQVSCGHFGHIEVKRGHADVKQWGVIFTCLVSQAKSLEVSNSLHTDSCINALHRFLCRRGPVTSICTYNGTHFVGAQKELKDLKDLKNWITTGFRSQMGCQPPFRAHQGGVWERLIPLCSKRTSITWWHYRQHCVRMKPSWIIITMITLFLEHSSIQVTKCFKTNSIRATEREKIND